MPTTPESASDERLATTDRGIWQEAAERLKLAVEAESQYRDDAIEDLEFGDGRQWPDDLYNFRKINKRPSLTFNFTDMIVRRIINNMRAQRPQIKTHPVSQATVEDAKVVNGLLRHIQTLSKAEVAYDTGGEFAVRIGWGFWRIISEYIPKAFEQEVKIVPVRNPFTVYMDPSAVMPDGSDQRWCIISHKMKKTEYRLMYPHADMTAFTNFGPGDMLMQDWQSAEEIRLAEYFRIYETREPLLQLTTGSGVWEDEWDLWADRIRAAGFDLAKQNGQPIKRPAMRRNVEWYLLNGVNILDRRARGGDEDKGPIPGEWIPVVRCEGNALDYNGQIRRKGVIRDLKDPARMVNYWQTAKTERLAAATKSPWILAEGQADGHPEWEDANQKPYNRLEYKPVTGPEGQPIPPPQRIEPAEVEAGFAEALQSSMGALMGIAGMPHEPTQDMPGQVISGKALRMRQLMSDISHFQYYDNQTMAVCHTGRILLGQIPRYYGTERMQRIVGEDGVPQMVMLNQKVINPQTQAIEKIKNDLTVGRYDVVMDTGPSYETKRMEAADAMLDLMRTPLGEVAVKVGADIIFRNMDWPGADELANRSLPLSPQGFEKALGSMSDEAKAVAQAMQQQVMQLKAENQQLQMQVKYKTDIEHGWMAVELEKARVNDQTKQIDTHVRAQTAHNTTETKAATDIIVERMKQGHDERMADKQAVHEESMAAKQPNGSANG